MLSCESYMYTMAVVLLDKFKVAWFSSRVIAGLTCLLSLSVCLQRNLGYDLI